MRAATGVKNGCAFLFVVLLVLNALNALGQLVYTNDFTTRDGDANNFQQRFYRAVLR